MDILVPYFSASHTVCFQLPQSLILLTIRVQTQSPLKLRAFLSTVVNCASCLKYVMPIHCHCSLAKSSAVQKWKHSFCISVSFLRKNTSILIPELHCASKTSNSLPESQRDFGSCTQKLPLENGIQDPKSIMQLFLNYNTEHFIDQRSED